MKKIFLILAVLFSVLLQAQQPKRFYSTFGGNGDDVAYSGKITLDKQYIIAGSTSSYGTHGNTDAYLVKVDSMGAPIWHKYIGGFGNDVAKSVIQLPDSGYVIAGYTNSFGAGGYDAYLVRTDKDGNTTWYRTFGGLDWDFASDLVYGPDASIIVVGNTSSFGSGKKDGFVIKYDLAGNLLWQKFYGGAENEELRSIIKTNDNFFATVGYTESHNDINGDCYFLKLNSNGDTIFTKTFGGLYKDYATDLVQKVGNSYVISGAKTYSANAKTQSLMYGMSPTGSFAWENHYYASSGDEEFSSLCNSYQLPAYTGFIRNVPVPGFKMQGNIFYADPSGYNYKVNSFGGGEDEDFQSIESTPDGGFLIVGSTLSFNALGKDIFIMKHDSTCYNYISVVGIDEDAAGIKPVIYYQNDEIWAHFEDHKIAESADIFDLTGKLIRKIYIRERDLRIDLSGLPNPIYLLKLNFPDGDFYFEKLINR